MVLPGHLGAGYIATRILLHFAHPTLTRIQTIWILIIGTLAGDFPDFDLVWDYFKYRNVPVGTRPGSHRHYMTHAPIIWVIISLIIVGIGSLAGSEFMKIIGWLFWIGPWTHFVLDSIEYGVMWLWPISKQRFYVFKGVEKDFIDKRPGTFGYYWEFITVQYMKRWTFWLEVAVFLIAVILLFRSF